MFVNINCKDTWVGDDRSGTHSHYHLLKYSEVEKSASIKGKQLKITCDENEFFLEKFWLLLIIVKSTIPEAGLAVLL